MASLNPTAPVHNQRGGSIQATLVGLVDKRLMYEQLMHACRGIAGLTEQKLLHRESVYRAAPQGPSQGASTTRSSYQLRVRLGKTSTNESGTDKFVQPMSLLCVGDPVPFPANLEKFLKSEDGKRPLPKPSIRRVVEVDVGHTCDEMLKLLGFETDFVFIRSGQQFFFGAQDRCSVMISELHKLQSSEANKTQTQQTPKLETDVQGNPVDNIFLVEVLAQSLDDTMPSVEAAVREVLYLADKLSPFVTLNTPDDTQPQLPGMVGMPNRM
mmetsp:Transcript_16595/g.55329  ORF Transcript_16595/g.55329 Transcript_16595/m.55329 type:complete len:269 (-) Transcript_16595:1670-2476(-)